MFRQCSQWLGEHDQWIKIEPSQEWDMFVSVDHDWEFGHDCYHVVVDGNLCGNLGVIQGRLSNIYYKC